MAMSAYTLGGHPAALFEPYAPPTDPLVGRDHELRVALAAWTRPPGRVPRAPLMVGAPGTGKNRIAYALARSTGLDLFVFQGHDEVEPMDLVFAAHESVRRNRLVDYVLSPIASAMVKGGIAFIDEIGKLRPRALAPLASLLDERRYLDATVLGERIHAHPDFRLIAATNPQDAFSERFGAYLQDRLRPIIPVGPLGADELEQVVGRQFASNLDGTELLARFWARWRECRPDVLPTPRDALYVFGMAECIAARERGAGDERRAGLTTESAPQLEPRHLEAAFRDMLHRAESLDEHPAHD